jgi:hypothetical protein
MQFVYKSLVLGANRYSVEGTKGGILYLVEPNSGDNSNLIGLEVKKLKMPYELFEQLESKRLPGEYEILVDAERGGKDRDTETVLSVKGQGRLEPEPLASLFGVTAATKAAGKVPDQPLMGAVVALVLGATRYELENGANGGRLYAAQLTSGRNPNQIGFELVKFNMPYELFDELAAKPLPGEYEIAIKLGRMGGDKANIRAIGINSGNYLDRERLLTIFGLSSSASAPAPAKTGTAG